MPRTPVLAVIDGEKYEFQFLGTSRALEIATEVGVAILPSVGKALPKTGKLNDLLQQDLDGVDLSSALETLAKNIQPKRTAELIAELCSVVINIEGTKSGVLAGQVFEDHFKGRIGDAAQVAVKSFSVNCGAFFKSVVGAALKSVPTTTIPEKASK